MLYLQEAKRNVIAVQSRETDFCWSGREACRCSKEHSPVGQIWVLCLQNDFCVPQVCVAAALNAVPYKYDSILGVKTLD